MEQRKPKRRVFTDGHAVWHFMEELEEEKFPLTIVLRGAHTRECEITIQSASDARMVSEVLDFAWYVQANVWDRRHVLLKKRYRRYLDGLRTAKSVIKELVEVLEDPEGLFEAIEDEEHR